MTCLSTVCRSGAAKPLDCARGPELVEGPLWSAVGEHTALADCGAALGRSAHTESGVWGRRTPKSAWRRSARRAVHPLTRSFTLVEILVALVVTAVVVPVTLRALMLGARLDESAAQHRQAMFLAELKLQELVVTTSWVKGETNGDFGDDYRGFRWELVTDSWRAVDVAMRRLDLTVHGPGRGSESKITLTTLVPEPSSQ